jgi:stress-induced-phosphoprotein 1
MSTDEQKAQADALKAQGNEHYKARRFDDAKKAYQEAWETHKDITYLNNLAGASGRLVLSCVAGVNG